jgi:hypothetical protein
MKYRGAASDGSGSGVGTGVDGGAILEPEPVPELPLHFE